MQQININNDLLVTQRLPDGYTWTLASRLSDMLYMAEELFGPRDYSYTILGIEFVDDGPRIWYPGNRKHIIIQLDPSAAIDMSQACYQLAQEVVHLLAPTGSNDANNFEEGVSCYFAAYYMNERFSEPNWHPDAPNYERVLNRVAPLLDTDISCVRRLRNEQPSFSKMSQELISTIFPNLTPDNVNFLIKKFD
ncbi:MAG: hypothetical protein OXU36_23925 [Candidatus Poribacteria bacterium]|nr:hypothetical protein [Candidatus Poribacteria bacterium]